MFARSVVLREPVNPFLPGAHCQGQNDSNGPIPIIDSQVETEIYFWSLFTDASNGVLHHSWVKNGVERYGEDIKIGESGWWRSWSAKSIVPKEDTGKWKVVVSRVDEQTSKVLCVVHFRIE